eukprot:c18180_g1_i1.p1 GENE.c18180_g1_i1~~c18180_g1_i1.p1  ORF type:complete len:728 (-),score=233.95 c18180_g1_i1:67-2211(-)
MKTTTLFSLCVVLLIGLISADIYMHNPRGSNDRNCRNDNGEDRRNANRLFDSQNNDKGGYSCPRRYPFPAGSAGRATVNEFGKIISSTTNDHIDTPVFTFYAGSILHLEWTSQHACGSNDNTDCRMVIQYACNDPAPASTTDATIKSMISNPYIRDGTPITNNDGDNTNDEATTTIPATPNNAACTSTYTTANCTFDGRYGFQEPYANYLQCQARRRNFGLFTADQLPITDNNANRAINTRQNPNGNRYGLECPEERDYYPYWVPSIWKDVAVGVKESELATCEKYVKESQNVVDKCICISTATPNPMDERDCATKSGTWKCGGKWNLPTPSCFALPWTRDNHLGNTIDGHAHAYNWTLPSIPAGVNNLTCVLRLRYNITTGDFNQTLDSRNNCNPNDLTCTNSPIADRDNRESMTYLNILEESDERYNLSFAINTDQHARTFQDRSYAFNIVPLPSEPECTKKVWNLNVRGKRGNIVQTYPAVEYDFAPADLALESEDCVHIQWIGSDYNPDRNPNNGEGGPPNPNNVNEAKADRSNFVQMADASRNFPLKVSEMSNPFFSDSTGKINKDLVKRFAFIDQDISACKNLTALRVTNPNNRNARERDPANCAKLNAAANPYFRGALVKVYNQGVFHFMSTRNNNFSNRSQKVKITVGECTSGCSNSKSLDGGQIAGVVIGSAAACGLLGFAFYKFGGAKAVKGRFGASQRSKQPA